MITMRRQLLGLGFVAASSLVALSTANAMSGPSAITFDGGPFGSLNLSGGFEGYFYGFSGKGEGGHGSNIYGNGIPYGGELGSALIEVQKTTGEVQFTLEAGSTGGAVVLGAGQPGKSSLSTYSYNGLYAGYVTIAPSTVPGFTFSAGQIGSLEGFESGIDWNNANQLTTDIFNVQNSQNRGIEASYSTGPISATVAFGDGWDTGVFNYVQAIATYTINSTNAATVYYAGDEGRTGLNAQTYGYGSGTTVGEYGAYFVNSQMFGGFYSYTLGSLNLVPEAQFVYAKADHKLGIDQFTANLGTALFADYSFGTSPYSVGAWVQYEKSYGYGDWFGGPKSEEVGLSVSPTWQYKYLFGRADVGASYFLRNASDHSGASTYGYGSNGTTKFTVVGLLEGGVLF